MGKRWDYDVPSVEIWGECLRILKPGGHLLAFAGTRTQHRMAVRIEDAGFEIRDMIAWVYGSGFPKSLDVSKAIDKAAGAEREVVGQRDTSVGNGGTGNNFLTENSRHRFVDITAPATPEAQQWAGWGTALKPALEPVTMARKPFPGTVAANVLEHGTGAINVDGCRVEADDGFEKAWDRPISTNVGAKGGKYISEGVQHTVDLSANRPVGGRWPANLIHDGSDEVVELFPEVNSARIGNLNNPHRGVNHTATSYGQGDGKETHDYRDSGSAARFFYTAKATRAERQGVTHPTVKPLDLMAYLCRLVTPPGGTVLDPFMGSGTTIKAALSEGFNAIGIERDPAYFAMAQHRMDGAQLGINLSPTEAPDA
jgi:site-specific DNA-methyltransferase (adenine-specific)